MAAAEALRDGAHGVQAFAGRVGVTALKGQQRAHQGQADFTRHGVVGAARVVAIERAFGAARHPCFGRAHAVGREQGQHHVHVVEDVIARLRVAAAPGIGQSRGWRHNVFAQQMQPPQQSGSIEPLQRDLHARAAEVLVGQAQHARDVHGLEPEQRLVPPQVHGETIALGPLRLVLAQPGRAFFVAPLHLHDMRHGVDRPGPARVGLQGLAADVLGMRVEVAFLEAEGVQAQHVGVQRIGLVPLGQGPRRARAQLCGVAPEEVPQLRPLQRQGIARVAQQHLVPGRARVVPAAVEHLLQRLEVAALGVAGVVHQGRCVLQMRLGLRHHGRLGEAQQEAGFHEVRQGPAGVGLRCGVEVGQRRVVEGHEAPQGALRSVACSGHAAATGASTAIHG